MRTFDELIAAVPPCTRQHLQEAVQEALHTLRWLVRVYIPTGSTLLAGEGNDCDVVVQVHDLPTATAVLGAAGFDWCGKYMPELDTPDRWLAVRRGVVNIILTDCAEVFDGWCTATGAAMALYQNGVRLTKQQRAALFTAVRYPASPAELLAFLGGGV